MSNKSSISLQGIAYKRMFDIHRDVDHYTCIHMLIKAEAKPTLRSARGTLPIFKALKSSFAVLQLFLDYQTNKDIVINVIDNKKKSPLCKLAAQPESEDNL